MGGYQYVDAFGGRGRAAFRGIGNFYLGLAAKTLFKFSNDHFTLNLKTSPARSKYSSECLNFLF